MATKTKKKITASEKWKKADRFPVIFWIAGKLKRAMHAKAKAGKTSCAALFRGWAANGFPVKPTAKKKAKPKARKANHAAPPTPGDDGPVATA